MPVSVGKLSGLHWKAEESALEEGTGKKCPKQMLEMAAPLKKHWRDFLFLSFCILPRVGAYWLVPLTSRVGLLSSVFNHPQRNSELCSTNSDLCPTTRRGCLNLFRFSSQLTISVPRI